METTRECHMASLAEAIKAESEVLERIAAAPLPDLSFLNAPASNQTRLDSSPSDDRIGNEEVTSLQNEIKTLLDTECRSKWALDAPHTFGERIPDIRALKPDAAKLLNDKDGDKASLYWYTKCVSAVHPNHDLSQDPIYYDLADRVAFGFSLNSLRRQKEEKDADAMATLLADKLMKVIAASNPLDKHGPDQRQTNAKNIDADNTITSRNEPIPIRHSREAKRYAISHGTQTSSESTDSQPQQCNINANGLLNGLSIHHKPAIALNSREGLIRIDPHNITNVPNTSERERLNSHPPLEQSLSLQNYASSLSKVDIQTSAFAPSQSTKYSRFVDGIVDNIKNLALEPTDYDCYANSFLSARNVREMFKPLLVELAKAGRIHGVADPSSAIVDVMHSVVGSEPMTLTNFLNTIFGIASSLSESLVDQMGGKEAVVQSSKLIYKHFTIDGRLMTEDLTLFFRDVGASGSSRISALFVGRLLEKVGQKDGLTALQVVGALIKSHQKNQKRDDPPEIPQTVFLKWLASLKPKFSTSEMENLLSDISCSHDANLVSMTQFMQLCLPHQTCSARELKHKLSFVFSECLLGLTWLHQVIESCREKGTQQSGLIGWQEFLEVRQQSIKC
jgi:hypothetical protein